jgi:type II secretory pathway pseudopilin PulG
MKTSLSAKRCSALTLIEVLMVIVAVMIITAVVLPALVPRRHINSRIQCVNNLKQIALATRVWEGDNGDKFPMAISETNGGTMEFTTGMNAWRHFQIMSNELSTPRILWCPNETNPNRFRGTNFTWLNNSNLSFFVDVDASNDLNPQMILSGDRNITNSTSINNSLLELTTNQPAGWTTEMHKGVGNLALADGSVQQVSITGLRSAVANTGIFTNRLQMPILTP